MNRPDKAGEPSMEEILASIRQIIADEPSTDPSEPAIEANPLVPQSPPQAARPSETRVPLADRLSNVLKNGSLPPTSPLGSKRPLSFDQDLADMFDEEAPANGSSVVTPKPELRVPSGLSHPMAGKPFVPAQASETPKPEPAPAKEQGATPALSASVDGAAALPPQLAAAGPLVPPPPFGVAEKPAELPPAPTYGFPPLRKTSFYPPQPKTPAAPAAAPPDVSATQPPAPASDMAAPAGDASRGAGGAAAPAASGGSRFIADPARVPSQPFAASAPSPRYEAPPAAPLSPFASSAPSVAAPPSALGGASAQPAYGSAPGDPVLGAPPRPFAPLSERPVDTTPAPPVESRPSEPRPVEPRSYADPFAQSVRPAAGYAPRPHFAAEPALSTDAAHQALDALAQGLAASAAASPAPPEPVSPAVPLTPVVETPELRPPPAPASTLPATIPAQASLPVNRTLEDAVADMLRPMLQQWVAENMPRIIERALRTEVAQTVKPGPKPPGT